MPLKSGRVASSDDGSSAAAVAAAGPSSLTGVKHVRKVPCEARCACAVEQTVWVAERTGNVVVRNGRTGEVLETIPTPHPIVGTAMVATPNREVWVGTQSGVIHIFASAHNQNRYVCELSDPNVEHGGEIHQMTFDRAVFVASQGCRVVQWDHVSKAVIRSFAHDVPVFAAVTCSGLLFSGLADGTVKAWEISKGTFIGAATHIESSAVTCATVDTDLHRLWVGRANGELTVFRTAPEFSEMGSLRDARSRLTSLAYAGGKILGAGLDRVLYVWHAETCGLLGRHSDHSALIFYIGRIFEMTTTRVWTLGNDRAVNVYDAEGFFNPVSGAAESDALSQSHALLQSVKAKLASAERRCSTATEKMYIKEDEVVRLKDELATAMRRQFDLERLLDSKTAQLKGTTADHERMADEMNRLVGKVAQITTALAEAEREKMNLRAEATIAEERASKASLEATQRLHTTTIVSNDNESLKASQQNYQQQIDTLKRDLMDARKSAQSARDEAAARAAEVARKQLELNTAQEAAKRVDTGRRELEEQIAALEETRRRLEDQLIVKDLEAKQLMSQIHTMSRGRQMQESELHDLNLQRASDAEKSGRLHDSLTLKSHHYSTLKAERDSLQSTLENERQQARAMQDAMRRLEDVNADLRRQLDHERHAIKLLEDQYSVFQFVINSRGELVSQLWEIHGRVDDLGRAVRTLDNNIKSIDPTSEDRLRLKREWREGIVARAGEMQAAVGNVARDVDYIIANYLSDYEKRHLGVPSAKFMPDQKRPTVINEKLLTRLRDVTLQKQFTPNPGALNQLPPPYSAALGPQHIAAGIAAAAAASSPVLSVGAAASSVRSATPPPAARM